MLIIVLKGLECLKISYFCTVFGIIAGVVL